MGKSWASKRCCQLDGCAVDAFSVALMERPGARGQPLSKASVHAYARAVRGFLTWCEREGEAVKARPALPRLPHRILDRATNTFSYAAFGFSSPSECSEGEPGAVL